MRPGHRGAAISDLPGQGPEDPGIWIEKRECEIESKPGESLGGGEFIERPI